MKKVLALSLAMALAVTSLVACGSSSDSSSSETTAAAATEAAATEAAEAGGETEAAESTEAAADAELPHFTIGILPWSLTDTEVVRLMEWFDEIGEAFNIDFMWVESTTDETLITNIETLIEAGCDAIMPYYITEAVAEVCDSKGVYFAEIFSEVEGDVLEACEASDYWLGGTHENDYASGLAMVNSLYEQGSRNFSIIGLTAGQLVIGDARFAAFKEGVETLMEQDPEVTLVGEYRGTDSIEAVENFLSLYPEMDGIANACGGGGRNEGIVQLLETTGNTDVLYGCINAVEDAEYWFDVDALNFMVCGQHPDAVFTFLMVYNQLLGTPLSDTPTYMEMNYLYVTPANLEDYEKYVMGDTFPYTNDELKQFIKYFNEDATIEQLVNAVESYSVEEIASRR